MLRLLILFVLLTFPLRIFILKRQTKSHDVGLQLLTTWLATQPRYNNFIFKCFIKKMSPNQNYFTPSIVEYSNTVNEIIIGSSLYKNNCIKSAYLHRYLFVRSWMKSPRPPPARSWAGISRRGRSRPVHGSPAAASPFLGRRVRTELSGGLAEALMIWTTGRKTDAEQVRTHTFF